MHRDRVDYYCRIVWKNNRAELHGKKMKFGKEFVAQMVQEWQPAYVDYRFLKMVLKDIMRYKQRNTFVGIPGGIKKARTFSRAFSGLTRRSSNRHNEEEVILMKNTQHDGNDKYETMFLMADEEGAEFDVVFFKRLDEELNKVNKFYRSKVEELLDEAIILDKQMESLIAFGTILRNPYRSALNKNSGAPKTAQEPATATPMSRLNDGRYNGPGQMEVTSEIEMSAEESEQSSGSNFNPNGTQSASPYGRRSKSAERPEALEIIKHVKINIMPETPRSTLRSILTDPETRYLNKEDLRKGKKMLRTAFVQFYQKLRLVKGYSSLNILAFSKIMKKYDKVTGRRVSQSYISVVEKSYLGSCEEVNTLLYRVEASFTKHFTNANHTKAVRTLRPTSKRQKRRVTFCIGLFTGCSIALLVGICIVVRVWKIYNNDGATQYMDAVFPLYSMLGFIFLHMLMYAADIYLWQRYRINYPFIFGFKSGTELGYREVLLITTGISLFSLAGIISNLQMKTEKLSTIAESIPLLLVSVLLLILFCPFNILYRSSRFFLLRSTFHCICAPFYKVLLRDFFLADQLTSQVQAIRYFLYLICYYGWGHFISREIKFMDNTLYKFFNYVIAVIPFWIRFLQCIRRLIEERDPMQGNNALKFLSIVVAVIMRTAYTSTKSNIWMVMSFLTSTIATTLCIYWDLVIDWGLLCRNSQNPWLRDKLVINQNIVYFVAMILNVLLRFAWLESVINFHISYIHQKGTIAIFASLEIIRRGIWNFFRLENEHLNNVGKYRAFKSVPLPFHHADSDGSDN